MRCIVTIIQQKWLLAYPPYDFVDGQIDLWHNPKNRMAVKRTSRSVNILSEPGTVRAGEHHRSKIISEPQAEIGQLVDQK
jgi:hypothetical protein